jgi:hypothetical protein
MTETRRPALSELIAEIKARITAHGTMVAEERDVEFNEGGRQALQSLLRFIDRLPASSEGAHEQEATCSHPLIGEVASGALVCRDCGQRFELRAVPEQNVTADTAPLLAQLQWIGEAVEGLDVSEFAESFPLVRAVADLKRASEGAHGRQDGSK